MPTTDVTIDELAVKELADAQIAELHRLACAERFEAQPEDPLTPIELFTASLRNIPDFADIWAWLARDADGVPRGIGQAVVARTGDNEHIAEASVFVEAPFREKGIGRTLLERVVDRCEREGRRLLVSGSSERVPAGGAFAERIGASVALRETVNRLDLATVDRDLVDRWAAEGPNRAPGYSLRWVDGEVSDADLPDVLAAWDIMNTAPREDLDMEDQHVTPEIFRAQEKARIARGGEYRLLLAHHDESGAVAGFTDVKWNPAMPDTIHQGGTAVHPDHRGHALGKWLKAAMLQRILDEGSPAKDIRTGNANSNDAMLGINRELGFRPYIAHVAWQVEVETVKQYLAAPAATSEQP
ncbi:MAG TPA: GNAT family N-acetyltransferase [Acidimicrobiales bacterium]|nr:GNAT family N-acetyltransferase [Acidimicrobiales bacterium]